MVWFNCGDSMVVDCWMNCCIWANTDASWSSAPALTIDGGLSLGALGVAGRELVAIGPMFLAGVLGDTNGEGLPTVRLGDPR